MYTLILTLNIISLLFSAFLAIYAYRIKNNVIAFSFFLLMSIFAFWGGVKIVGILADPIDVIGHISYILRGITIFTPSLLLFIVIRYTQYPHWFTPRHTKYFFAIPALLAFTSFFQGIHHILYLHSNYSWLSFIRFHDPIIELSSLIYLYSCLLLALIILFRNLFNSPAYFNKQLIFIIIAIALPAINDILFRLNISLISGYHLTPEMFTVGNIFFAWALFGYRFLKLTPITNSMVIDSIDDVMVTTNRENLIIDINSSCERKFNVKCKNIVGKPFFDVFKDYPSLIAFYGNPTNNEIQININDQCFYFSAKYSLVEYPKNDVLAAVILLHDISEVKKAEIQIKEYSKKMENLNATKDLFFSIIAHDLRNPFHSILNLSRLSLSKLNQQEYDKVNRYLNTIHDVSQHTYYLLEDLLQWASSQDEKLQINPVYFNLTQICNEAINLIKPDADKKDIRISIPLEPVQMWADLNMMKTVLRNLLTNAVKYSHVGGLIEISITITDLNTTISVKDTGIGIKADDIPKIWTIAEKHTTLGTNNERGSGLGLILSKKFIEEHHGSIWVESQPGQGSTFNFMLPNKQF